MPVLPILQLFISVLVLTENNHDHTLSRQEREERERETCFSGIPEETCQGGVYSGSNTQTVRVSKRVKVNAVGRVTKSSMDFH